MCILKETKDDCFVYVTIYITLDYMSCLLTVTYVSSIQSRSINSHVQYYGCNMKLVCFQVS